MKQDSVDVDDLAAGHEDRIAQIVDSDPIPMAFGGDAEGDSASDNAVEDWFAKINRQNAALAREYDVETNAQGISMAPGLLDFNARVKQYYINHPEDRFQQRLFSEMNGKEIALDRPKTSMPTRIESGPAPEVKRLDPLRSDLVSAIDNLSEDRVRLLLSAIKELGNDSEDPVERSNGDL